MTNATQGNKRNVCKQRKKKQINAAINKMHQRYWEHIRYHWLLLAWLLPGYKVTKVTWVTRVTRVTRLRCLYKSSKLIQGSKVSEVTGVTEGFCWWFSLTSLELQGYKGCGPFSNFQKIKSRLQGFRSYEGYGGLLLMIFLDIPRVTRLRRLRCFFLSNFQQQKCAKFAFMFYR